MARPAGFTLLEMIVVLAILGLVGTLVLQRGPASSPGVQLQIAAGDVARLMRGARARAIALGQVQVVQLDPPARAIASTGERPYVVPRELSVAFAAMSGDWGGGRSRTIRFWPDGSASGGVIELAAGARRQDVIVDWFTGRVRLADAR